MNSNAVAADQVAANGMTSIGAALFSMADAGNTTLTSGTVLTVINNTAATPMVGTFVNLADGGTLTVGSDTLQASYAGGDGNDLTLTVVP